MDREEILKMSKNENQVYDEREQAIRTKSSAIAKAVGIALGFIIVLIETVFFEKSPTLSMAVFSVCFCMDAVESWYRFAFLKEKFDLVRALLFSAFTVAFLASMIVLLCKG